MNTRGISCDNILTECKYLNGRAYIYTKKRARHEIFATTNVVNQDHRLIPHTHDMQIVSSTTVQNTMGLNISKHNGDEAGAYGGA